jgi:predicted RNA-binding protein YlxR (DUF448 family)
MTASRRHVPLRTCIVCGNKTPKQSLTRVVANADGVVSLDLTGKLPGRGTYVCSDGSCIDQGLKRGRLEHALRTKLGNEEWTRILAAVEALSVGHDDAS